MTRAMVQGFIDGLKAVGQLDNLEQKVREWLKTHHTYPCGDQEADAIVADLGSYKK